MWSTKRIGLYIVLASILLTIGYGFLPRPVLVETAKVNRRYMRVTIDEEGKTRVTNRFVVSAPVAGFALRIDLDVGDAVSKDEVITELVPLRSHVLDPRSRAEAKARIAAAEAALNSSKEKAIAVKATAELAEKEFERVKMLFEDDVVTRERLDIEEARVREAEAILRSSQLAVEVARHELEAALAALQYSAAKENQNYAEKVTIKAPVSGRVLSVERKSEGVVYEGQALLTIGDPRVLEVEVDVLSSDAVRIKPGTRVLFERWGGDVPLEGRVRIVEPAGFTKISALGVEEQRVLVISDIVSPPEMWVQLGDGYRVEARFILWEDDNVLQVPTSSLFRYQNGWAVFILNDGRARLRTVQIGYRNGLSAKVISGLNAGDTVITYPDSSIKDNTRVLVRETN